MTTRNFRVKNGLEVGDVTIDSSTNKITGLSTSNPSDPGDVATKAYVDAQVTASDLDFQAGSGGALSIDLDSETLTFTGGTGIDTSGAGNAVTFAIDSTVTTLTGSQTLTNKTLTTPVISSISNTGTLTLPTSSDTLVGRATTDTLTNKTFDANGTGNSLSNVEVADFAGSAIINVSETLASNDSDTALVTAGAIIDYVDAQDAAIASDTLTFTNKTIDANGTGNAISNIDAGNLLSGFLKDEDNMASNSATSVASQQSIKAYVDTEIGNLSSTTLTAGNTTAVVSDTGSDGAFTVTADGNTELVVNDTSATFSGNVVVSGNLTVNGTTTTVATTNTTVSDSLIEYGNGTTGSPSNDAGIVIERGDSANAFIGFDESEDKFRVGTGTFTGASTGNLTITTGTLLANIEGNVTGAVTGNADTATTLETARNIGGVSFNGSANINLPGVNTAGNQDTSGNAATATTLETARNIGGVSFNGSANINLPGVNTAGNQNTSGTAAIGTAVTVTANNSTNETVYLTFVDGATGTQGIETDTGLSYNPSTNVLSTTASAAQYADVAERFEADAPMEIGSVVEVGGSAEITEATSDLSEDVFGVISDKPAYMMNAGAGDNTTHPFVAMTGRTPVRVIGEVTKGQRLVTSSTKGCARAVAQGESISPFNVIGRALESNTEAGIKLVNCAVRTNN